MVAGRFLQGMAAAALAPSALSLLVHNTEDAAARAKAVSLWSTSAMLATLVGSAVGGLLVDHWGRRSIFALNVPIGIVVYVVGAKAIDESADPEHTALDPAGQLLGALWLAALSWGLIEGGRRGWATPPTITAFGLAFAAFAAFLAVEMRQERPMLPLALDSPGMSPALKGKVAKITVPLKGAVDAAFDAVTAELQVNAEGKAPLLCVTGVTDVASGDLSMPGRIEEKK